MDLVLLFTNTLTMHFLCVGIVYGSSQLQVPSCFVPDSAGYRRLYVGHSGPNLEFSMNMES